jgi:predicted lactoylglutathione lyase
MVVQRRRRLAPASSEICRISIRSTAMTKMIFVNLPVADVAKATTFYEALGARRDPRFCDETTSMMMFSDSISFMLMSHARFRDFTSKPIIDAHRQAQVLLCLSETSRAAVDATAAKAVAAGGKADPCPKQDYGFMYGRSFEDLDGHIVELAWMDVEAALAANSAPAA